MKGKIKKIIKVGFVLGTVYMIGRWKGFSDTVDKYKDSIALNELCIGVFTRNEAPGTIGWMRPVAEATDAK